MTWRSKSTFSTLPPAGRSTPAEAVPAKQATSREQVKRADMPRPSAKVITMVGRAEDQAEWVLLMEPSREWKVSLASRRIQEFQKVEPDELYEGRLRPAAASRALATKSRTRSGSLRPGADSTPLATSTPAGRTRRIASATLSGFRPPARMIGT